MLDALQYATFVLACVVVVIVPGPTVTVIVANSLRSGAKSGLLNVAGTQLGLTSMLLIVAAGLEIVVNEMAVVFDWIRMIGAAYLIWLGIKLLRARGHLMEAEPPRGGSYFWQGFLVVWSNPKSLAFLGAFIPQFVDPSIDATLQILALGGTFMFVATILDGSYALVSGRAGKWMSHANVRRIELTSGSFLIAGGLWLALSRR
jgi:threonine/homoserine/homoserine lactone efflux protein